MDSRQRRENERNVRAGVFLDENAADFAGNAVAAAKIAELRHRVGKSEQEFQKQLAGDGAIRQDYNIYRDKYDAMVGEMRDIRDFATAMADDITGLEKKFRLPRTGGKSAMIAAAYVFADEAAEYEQQFLEYGMDAGFIADLRTKADAAKESVSTAETSTGERIGATDNLEEEISKANKIVETIDPIVRRLYRTNSTKLAAWDYASHVERHTPKPRGERQETPKM